MFKNMGGNIPGGHFLGGNFLGGSFPDTTFTFEDIVQKGVLKNLQDSQ